MKKYLSKINYIELILWIINIIGLLVIIIIPKDIELVNKLFAKFMLLYIFLPLMLLLSRLVIAYRMKHRDDNIYDIIPFIGIGMIMPMVIFYFISSLNTQGKIIVIIMALVVLAYNVISSIVVLKKKGNIKIYLILLFISILVYGINIYTMVMTSYNYSISH